MQISFDRQKCQGHAQCAAKSPQFYELDEEGFCALGETTEVALSLESEAELGAAACPEGALSVMA